MIPLRPTATLLVSAYAALTAPGCAQPAGNVERISTTGQRGSRDVSTKVLEALEAHVRASIARNGTPGIALALTDRDGLVAQRAWGFADTKTKAPVTEQTLFQIGSITKSFTALALLLAEEDGQLQIDAPVTRFLPWFEVQSEFAPIQVEHLLTHTAGIPADRDDIFSSPYFARALRERHTAWAPGTRFLYSNVGYQTLHVVLESVSDRPYADIIEERIFEPLGMTSSHAAIRFESRPQQAIAYVPPFDDRPTHRSRALVEAPFQEYEFGDGCIQSTAQDLASYVRMWLNHGACPGGRIVSEESFTRFSTAHPATVSGEAGDSTGYGFGVVVTEEDGLRYLTHTGGMVGQYAFAGADMTGGHGVAVLVNGPGEPWALGTLALEIWRALEEGDSLPDVEEPADPLVVENAPDYVGQFHSSQAGSQRMVELKAKGDALFISAESDGVHGEEDVPLETMGADTFYTPIPGFDRYPMTLGRDAAGEIVELIHGPDWYTNHRYTGPAEFAVPAKWSGFAGRYRSYSPWLPYFEVIISKGSLVLVTGVEGGSSDDWARLVPLGDDRFQVGEDVTPETLQFLDVIDGRALRATWAGHPFFRQ